MTADELSDEDMAQISRHTVLVLEELYKLPILRKVRPQGAAMGLVTAAAHIARLAQASRENFQDMVDAAWKHAIEGEEAARG